MPCQGYHNTALAFLGGTIHCERPLKLSRLQMAFITTTNNRDTVVAFSSKKERKKNISVQCRNVKSSSQITRKKILYIFSSKAFKSFLIYLCPVILEKRTMHNKIVVTLSFFTEEKRLQERIISFEKKRKRN